MKSILLFVAAAIAALSLQAQITQKAPVNPAYIQYIQSGSPASQYGYLPPIIDLQAKQYTAPSKGPLVLPATFDLRTLGYVTSVKNQGGCGSCWTFATVASTESYWLRQGQGTFDLSEDNINNCHDFDWLPCEGGNAMISAAYLSRGSGMMSEASDPYNDAAGTCPTTINPVKYVSDVRYVPDNTAIIKQILYDYGAVYTSYYSDDVYLNSSNDTYYYSGTDYANHAVTLVGWDDTKVTDGGTGAWIVKNSWGTSWGENGFFYISYNDSRINSEAAYFPGFRNFSNGDEVLTYAKYGEINDIGLGSTIGYGLISYSVSTNSIIKAVGTYIASGNSTVSIEIYSDFDGTNLSNLIDTISSKSCSLPGYYSFDLPNPVVLMSGENIYIKVKYSTPGYSYPIPVEEVYSGFASNVTLETGKCWVSSNGTTWNAAGSGTSREYDLCINLYTSAAGIVTTAFSADVTSTCTGIVSFSDESTNSPTNWLWTFGDGQTSTVQNPVHYYTSNGTFTVKLKSWNIFGTDSLIRTSYVTVGLPAAPTATDASICSGQTATLTATGSGTLEWYDAQYGGNLVFTGSSFTTPALSNSTDYFVQSAHIPGTSVYGGNQNSTSGGNNFTASSIHHLNFDAAEDCRLISVEVNASTTGNRTITLKNSAGTVLQTATVNIATTGVSRITLNFEIPAGSGYQLVGPAYPNLYRNNLNVSYPYEVSPISITGSSAGSEYYYFFYDWEVQPYCSSPRTTASVVVSGPDNALNISGNYSICDGDSLTLTAASADAYYWYPNGETTQSITVNTPGNYYALITGSSCDVYTDTVAVSLTSMPTVDFTWTINMNIAEFTSVSTHATNYYWEFGDGATSSQANPAHYYGSGGIYTVNHYAWNACDTVMISHQISISTGIKEHSTGFRMWPNPAGDLIRISVESEIPSYIRIINMQGQELKRIIPTEKETVMQLNGISSGVYILECAGNEVERMRFVVE
ncbi:MAG: C1 family peptidase [Bacteroidales bacterium]|jgi:C1A family cysteine protease/PKD repeat protein|nr:C1 family peptidase [Bacteroidales bacterium]